jgi:tRNA pseudouridine38-40 synthase
MPPFAEQKMAADKARLVKSISFEWTRNRMHAPQTWKLTLAYDGTDYSGWQMQPGRATIQNELAAAIGRVTDEVVMPQGSGRTDAGVHALAQVVSFELAAPIPAENFKHALNKTLPAAIRVLTAEIVTPSFHARHSALRKTYEYRVVTGEMCSPFVARYVAIEKRPLDLEKMREAASHVVGEHDFTSFAAADPDLAQRESADQTPPSMVRTIFYSDWRRADECLVYSVTGTGFLHHMVRNLVGTFVDVGRGRTPAGDLPHILAARDRRSAGPTAPASGLFLRVVEYPGGAANDE